MKIDSKRATIVFGNGLGMALNPDYFKLDSGFHSVWETSTSLSPEQKKLIQSTIPTLSEKNSSSIEDKLDELQLALFAAETLRRYDDKKITDQKWLTDSAKEAPTAFKKCIHETSIYFHDSGKGLPNKFVKPLADYIKKTKSHVAILNYDNLLYDAFIAEKVLHGRDHLVDGYSKENGTLKFKKDILNRQKQPDNLGFFLHLHGSPLFTGNEKKSREERRTLQANEQCHIVLTHIKHKPTIISNSEILSEYWYRFDTALKESFRIILFGYSGGDDHLNRLVTDALADNGKKLLIIEWEGNSSEKERRDFWCDKLNLSEKKEILSMRLLPDILCFTEWDS